MSVSPTRATPKILLMTTLPYHWPLTMDQIWQYKGKYKHLVQCSWWNRTSARRVFTFNSHDCVLLPKVTLKRWSSRASSVSHKICATDGGCLSSASTWGIVIFVLGWGYLKPRGIYKTVQQWWCQGSLQLCSVRDCHTTVRIVFFTSTDRMDYGLMVAMKQEWKEIMSHMIN